jgi:carbon storage regulator
MLVLTRRPSESFTIGDNIRIVITEVEGKKVRVGIEAPRDLQIVRDDAKQADDSREHRAIG